MKKQKILSLLLALVMVICALGSVPVMAQNPDVGYMISSSEEDGGFVLHVALQNVKALGGRLAIAFDADKLELADTSSLTDAVKQANGAVITPEGLDTSVLLSNAKGYVMFAWYSSGNSGVNAASADVEIATIAFNFKNGATTDDFNRNTINLYYVNETMAHKWDCSAQIVTTDLMAYRNNDRNDEYVCGIDYDYPNCDYVPIVTYEAGVRVTDTDGNPLRASVMLDNLQAQTNAYGYTSFQMENGIYAYRVSAQGYETKSGYIIIRDGGATANVSLMSYAQIAQSTADSLAIGYEDGDSANSVTSNLVLPTEGQYGEVITWQSSNTSVVTPQGIVTRGEDDMRVTLTANVSLVGASAKRSFDITVKSRISAEEKNAAIVAQDKAALEIRYAPGDSQSSVTASLTLAEMGAYGSAIVWTSSNEDIITGYGVVTRPETDTQVKLTALILRTGAQDTKEFTVTVKGEKKQTSTGGDTSNTGDTSNNGNDTADTETVNRVLSALTIIYSIGDSASYVTNNLTLASEGSDGTVIEWSSSHPAVVTAYGGVVRQAQDVSVTLTATATKGNASSTKTFTVLVKAAPQIPVNPDNGTEEEIQKSNGSDAGGNGYVETQPTTAPSTGQTTTENQPTTTDSARISFNDIDSVPWAQEAILALVNKGVISGMSDTEYAPQSQIRRADFVILLVRMLGLDGEITESFDDVTQSDYYYEPVALAKSLGIISGVGDNKFAPESSITRQDMMVMTCNALEKLGKGNFRTADLSDFNDKNDIADYAYESVSKMVGAGYISGDGGNLNPKNNTTRAETAVFLYRIDMNLQ
ncbi:MAG: immunoglobulin-like domain-containing protein [Hominilimicola sp.]